MQPNIWSYNEYLYVQLKLHSAITNLWITHPLTYSVFSRLKWLTVQLVVWDCPKVLQASIAEKVFCLCFHNETHIVVAVLCFCWAFYDCCTAQAAEVTRHQAPPASNASERKLGWASVPITLAQNDLNIEEF